MFRLILCVISLFVIALPSYSYTWEHDENKPQKEEQDIYYDDDSTFFYVLPNEDTSRKNPSKRLTVNEKFRRTLHLPKTKKVYYHNIDKSQQPISVQHYEFLSKDVKRPEFKIPVPLFQPDKNIICPDPHYLVERYNTPPGGKNLELHDIYKTGSVNSQAILSPDSLKIVYSTVFSNKSNRFTGYNAHYIPVKEGTSIPNALKNAYVTQQEMKPIVSSANLGIEDLKLLTLIPLDWSRDSSKIAFKEQIGSTSEGVWKTNVVVYDFSTKKTTRLTSLPEAVVYWWRKNKNIDLKNYMWDLYPLGWSKENPDNLIFYAYVFTNRAPLFLGTWAVDYQDEHTYLISPDSVRVEVELNGYGLKLLQYSH